MDELAEKIRAGKETIAKSQKLELPYIAGWVTEPVCVLLQNFDLERTAALG
jgi:hypothetical protein